MIVAGSASPLLLSSAGGYNLTKSLRFRSSASAYLSRTPSSTGNRKTFTISYWMKRGTLGTTQYLFAAGSGTTESTWFQCGAFDNNGTSFDSVNSGTWTTGGGSTVSLFRDTASWYHMVWAFDTTQAIANNRVKLWVNGVQQTFNSVSITQNADLAWNNGGVLNYIGSRIDGGPRQLFDGYLAEVYNIDGQALTPSSFGQTSPTTGVWQPKRYTGTYGTNGFYLPFTDTTSTSTLGTDFSGNNNTWTVNNISLTSGATYDSMNDVPTLTSATAANYCVLNPLTNGSLTTLNGGNLNTTGNSASNNGNSRSSFAFSTGKWYAEFTVNGKTGTYPQYGIMQASDGQSPNNGLPQSGYGSLSNSVAYLADGTKLIANSNTAYGSSYTTGDVIGIAVDADNGAVYFSKNGTFQNSGVPTSGSSKTGAALTWTGSTVELLITIAEYNASGTSTNFGQRPFAYTPPTGFVALNTFNLSTPTIGATASTQAGKYFNAVLWTGNGSTPRAFTGIGFAPDFAWIKSRSTAADHALIDIVRGTGSKALSSNTTGAENGDGLVINSFDSDGYTLATGSINFSYANTNTANYVSWNWKANGSGVTNTSGSITSTVSANTTAGFSIVTYTGNGSNATIGHGLGVAPSMIIRKARNASAQNNWYVYHQSLSANGAVFLNLTDAYFATSSYWNNTAPTSTVFTVGSATNVLNDTWVAYCFAQVAGYSAFGSYTGNGSTDGPFVFCGFRPRFIMIKRTDSADDWEIRDTSLNPYNTTQNTLFANLSQAEVTLTDRNYDIVSNGFKLRGTDAENNGSGGTYIYMAFAESPFKYANAR